MPEIKENDKACGKCMHYDYDNAHCEKFNRVTEAYEYCDEFEIEKQEPDANYPALGG